MRYGAFRGPRLLTCGRIVSATAPGGRWFEGMYREADGPDDVRRAVREQLRRGADFIKVMTTGARSVELEDPDPAQLTRAEIATARRGGAPPGLPRRRAREGIAGTEIAIEEGIDTIEHGMYLNQRPDLLERMAAAGQCLVPTLSCFYGVAGLEHAVGDRPRRRHGRRRSRTAVPRPSAGRRCSSSSRSTTSRRPTCTLRAARAAGVPIAAGHDWHPFWNTPIEIRRMIAHGLSAAGGARRRDRGQRPRARARRARRHRRGGQARRPARDRRRPARAPGAAQPTASASGS